MLKSVKLFLFLLFAGAFPILSSAQNIPSKFRALPNGADNKPSQNVAQQNPSKIQMLSDESDVILAGRVTENRSAWNENKSRIFTRTTLQVDEYLKGSSSGTIVVSSPGGEVGNVGELYSDTPKFDVNENVIVFLKRDANNSSFTVVNGNEGKISVQNTANSAQEAPVTAARISSIKAEIKNYAESKK